MNKKICKGCKVEKPITEFHKLKGGKFGVNSKCKSCKSEYFQNNKEQLLEYKKEYCENNKEKINEYHKQYRENNREIIKERKKEWYKNNKDQIIKQINEYEKQRIKTDRLFKLTKNIRRLISISLKNGGFGKNTKTYNILGCTYEEFKLHLESQFESWMSWDNHGKYNGELNYGWDLDHIIPVSKGTTEEERIKLNHYSNFQPLCSYINRVIKRNNLNLD